jgi:hypothetical protein
MAMNSLDLRVTVPSENNRPVEGLENTLKATVVVGGRAKTMQLPLEPSDGQPCAYVARFIPTRLGSYVFEISGTVEGVAVDQRFESGQGRFHDVQSPKFIQWPDRVLDALTMVTDLSATRQAEKVALMFTSEMQDMG